MIEGKGYFIWQIARTEAGDIGAIVDLAIASGLTHVLIKIADGTGAYNVSATDGDLVPPLVDALRGKGVQSLGWHYIYGNAPDDEAARAIQRVQETGVVGYVIDAEREFKKPAMETAAKSFMRALRSGLSSFPVALSSYRYPSLHQEFPWQEFLADCDFVLPQVYWIGAHNPDAQLKRCLDEFQKLTSLPVIPTGAAFSQGDWSPTSADIDEFLDAARDLGLSGANFWEWYPARNLPEIWEAIADYDWDGSLPPPLPPSTGVGARVWVSALNVRSGPSSDYPVVSTIKQGEQVTVYSLDRAWVKISPNHEWWVYSYYLEPVVL